MKPFSLAMLLALLLPPLHTAHAEPLRVVNGDLGGLTPHGGHGWHQGVPAGWKSTAPFPLYAIDAGPKGTQPDCNVSQLGLLEQPVGMLPQAADVELTMDVTDES